MFGEARIDRGQANGLISESLVSVELRPTARSGIENARPSVRLLETANQLDASKRGARNRRGNNRKLACWWRTKNVREEGSPVISAKKRVPGAAREQADASSGGVKSSIVPCA